MSEVILTPIYNETTYKYHKCSECNSKIYFEEDILAPLRFEEKINYCPYCGNKVVRYGSPKYEELPDWSWMDKFKDILNRADRELEYEICAKMSRNERHELIDKADFGIKYFGSSMSWNGNSRVCEIIKDVAFRDLHYSYINKLKAEFESKE